jgi:hypothetical protein
MKRIGAIALVMLLALAACQTNTVTVTQQVTQEVTREVTREVIVTAAIATASGEPAQPSETPSKRKATPVPAGTQTTTISQATPLAATTEEGGIAPYPDAPLCPDTGAAHDDSLFHTLWDSVRGCHYDHEHGQDPFTPEVAAAFPGFDLRALLGNVGIGHTNPSSPKENTDKHGGFKWNVQLEDPENCAGFEGATYGANASVIQYHAFGDEAIELEARIHSTAALVRECSAADPTDYGYIYVVQFQDYGQRITPYQGTILNYPNTPDPAYPSPDGPYLSTDCVGPAAQCRQSLAFVLSNHLDVNSNWTSKNTGKHDPIGSKIFTLLFRLRDGYRLLDWNDQTYPYTYLWVCSSDGGATYNPVGCRYNNSTTQVQEIKGEIPAEWDNLPGFDTNPAVGRVTAQGFVTQFGDLAPACLPGHGECFPIKLVNAFVGTWGSVLVYTNHKGNNIVPVEPSRNIFFCGQQVCSENDPGAQPSGWIGPDN